MNQPISAGSSGGPLLLADGTLAGITTLTLSDAQNVNFAIPVSKVKVFLSSEYRPRDVAEGASIRWQKNNAFLRLKVSVESPRTSTSERSAGMQLEKAQEEIRNGLLDERGQASEHYAQAIALAERAKDALPNEFKYLACYTLGETNLYLAWRAESEAKSQKDRERKYRLSEYSRAAFYNLTEATKLKSDFSPAFRLIVKHHKSAGEWPQALVASETLVKLAPRSAEALQLRGDCYHELNQLESARNDLEAAIELAPRNGELYGALSWVLRGMKEYREAISCLEKQLELKHDPSGAHLSLGYTYRGIGQFNKAISEFELAKALGVPAFICDEEIAKCRQQLR